MTPEEQRLMAQFLAKMDPQSMVAGGGMPKGMTNPYTRAPVSMESQVQAGLQNLDPANMPAMTSWKDDVSNRAGQSTDAARARLENQQAYANQLKSTAMPEGQTVGPSGIYVRNPWDSASAGLQRLAGGYMQGKLNKKYDTLDEQDSETNVAKQRLADIGVEEDRAFRSGQSDKQIEAQTEAARIRAAAQAARYEQQDRQREATRAEAEERRIANARMNALDAGTKDINKTAERHIKDGTKRMEEFRKDIAKARKDGAGSGNKTATENTAEMRSKSLTMGVRDMKQVMFGDGNVDLSTSPELLYDPGSVISGPGFKDKVANSFDLTRDFSTPEGIIFASGSSTAKEALLRTNTGAAAPEGEQKEYMKTLIPSPGESYESIIYKMQKLEEFDQIMKDIAGLNPDATDEESKALYIEAANKVMLSDDRYQSGPTRRKANFDDLWDTTQ